VGLDSGGTANERERERERWVAVKGDSEERVRRKVGVYK
jgi:hypothetical protein